MTSPKAQTRWLWVDLETTGLGHDPDQPQANRDDVILEVAALVTDAELSVLDSFGPVPVTAREADLALMGDFVRDMHTSTGLLERVTGPDALPIEQVDELMSAWLQTHGLAEKVILAGSSVKLDQEFIRRHMPDTYRHLHYRVIDVSSFKEALRAWAPDVVAERENAPMEGTKHQAMDDIRASVAELAHYRQALGLPSPDRH